VLVVKAPGHEEIPLKGGDVIVSIDGREPRSPAHAMRILQSYERGDEITMEIMRNATTNMSFTREMTTTRRKPYSYLALQEK